MFILHKPVSFFKIGIIKTADLSPEGAEQRSVFSGTPIQSPSTQNTIKIIVPCYGVCISPFVRFHVLATFSVPISAHKHDIHQRASSKALPPKFDVLEVV